MQLNLTSQSTEIKPQIESRRRDVKDESCGESLSNPQEPSSKGPANKHQRTNDGQDRSQPSRQGIRFTAPSERPLLDLIERQVLNEHLLAMLKEQLRASGDSDVDTEEGDDNG